MSDATPQLPTDRPRRNPLIRLFTSIWFGLALLALILVYSSVLSAYAPARWALEMTEMQTFSHWLFVTLVILMGVSLMAATFLRTRWLSVNVGAIVTHLGLLLLLGGALVYFGTKVEGHLLLEAPRIQVRATANGQSQLVAHFPAYPGESWSTGMTAGGPQIEFEVVDTHWNDLALDRAGVQVRVNGLLTEDVTLTNAADDWQTVSDGVELRLVAAPPQRHFFDGETAALYIRAADADDMTIHPVEALPIYYDRYPIDEGLLVDSAGNPNPPERVRPELQLGGFTLPTGWLERWNLPIDVETGDVPFTLRVVGYVPFVVGVRPQQVGDELRTMPVLAPRKERRPTISPRAMSAICVEIRARDGASDWSDTQWCLFSPYPDVDARPLEIAIPGSEESYELIYSRLRRPLDGEVMAERLFVEYFPGRRGIKSYHSEIRLQSPGSEVQFVTVETNQICQAGKWTMYQSGFADDRWSYSILGVGNRNGMWAMNIGWIVITLGSLYAFYIKPVLLRRLVRRSRGVAAALLLIGVVLVGGCGAQEPHDASRQAAALDANLNWQHARLIAVQDRGRYKTLDSFARETMADMVGDESLPGLSPLASLMEWLFNSDAYSDTPVIKAGSRAIRIRLARLFEGDQQRRILETKRLTPRELFDPRVQSALAEMETEPMKRNAVGRLRGAQAYATRLREFVTIVPQPGGDDVAPWAPPQQALANLTDAQLAQLGLSRSELPDEAREPIPNMSPEQALHVVTTWSSLRSAWRKADVKSTQRYLDQLAGLLPALAAEGVYPSRSQLRAEAHYYAFGKFTFGWVVYFLAFLVSIWTLVTRWRTPWVITMTLMIVGLAIHAYGLSLRWAILDRIPVANMFEAVVASAWMGIVIALVFEYFLKTRVFLVGASATGFFALLAGGHVLPGAELGTIPAILDDIQLRIHTVLIIASYALIFLAAVIAVIYLIGFYTVWLQRAGSPALQAAANDAAVSHERPLWAGATPGDEVGANRLPQWLNDIDWSHLIIINMVFVLLFLGTITGAWWADYSWGRPWGWDPKEVFAMNTWIIYAILIHVRFVVHRRGLWTAWLSLLGCAMMAFNWFFVNFFISSVHSYV